MFVLDARAYPYLAATVAGLALLAVVSALARRQRRMILVSGLLAVSLVPAAATANDMYWSPNRLGGLGWGIEDVLFTLVVGGLSWFLAAWPFPRAAAAELLRTPALTRFACLYVASFGGYLALGLAGVDPLTCSLVVHVTVVAAVLARQRSLWPLAASGLAGSAAAYFLFLQAVFFIFPGFLDYWNHGAPWYQLVLGTPIGEILWGGSFGAAWPLVVAYCCGTEVWATAATSCVPASRRGP